MSPDRLVVVSPHLDDAVFGCCALVASHPHCIVLTVFAGLPPAATALPEWDAACGFASARDAMKARREEDRSALTIVGAEPRWMDFLDAQYREGRAPVNLMARIGQALAEADASTVALPLGLFHEDHRLVSDATIAAVRERPARLLAWEEPNYRAVDDLLDRRLEALRAQGLDPQRTATPRMSPGLKRLAVASYASQLRGLASAGRPGHDDLHREEAYWVLQP